MTTATATATAPRRWDVFHQLPRSVAGWNDTASSIAVDVAAGGRAPWWYARYRPELIIEKCIRSTTAPLNQRVLGIVAMWGHLTTDQVAAAARLPAAKALSTLRRLHVAGFLRRTSLVFRRGSAAALEVWSLSPDSDRAFDALRHRLPIDTWTNLTAGWPPKPSPQQSWTHDIAAAEIALRALAATDIATAWGVHCADLGLLSGSGRSTGTRQNPVADAVLWRDDGLPIAIEVQRSFAEPSISAKLQRWINLIRDHRDHAPAVVWVVVDDAAAPDRSMHRRLKTRIAELTRTNPTPSVQHRIAERIAVIHWRSWFPAAHRTSDTFTELTAQRPTGPIGDPWRPASLLDPLDLPYTAIDHTWWQRGIDRSRDWHGTLTT